MRIPRDFGPSELALVFQEMLDSVAQMSQFELIGRWQKHQRRA